MEIPRTLIRWLEHPEPSRLLGQAIAEEMSAHTEVLRWSLEKESEIRLITRSGKRKPQWADWQWTIFVNDSVQHKSYTNIFHILFLQCWCKYWQCYSRDSMYMNWFLSSLSSWILGEGDRDQGCWVGYRGHHSQSLHLTQGRPGWSPRSSQTRPRVPTRSHMFHIIRHCEYKIKIPINKKRLPDRKEPGLSYWAVVVLRRFRFTN